MPDRRKVNLEIDRIVSHHLDDSGKIPALNVAEMRRDLKHTVDSVVGQALDYGVEIAAQGFKNARFEKTSTGYRLAKEVSE